MKTHLKDQEDRAYLGSWEQAMCICMTLGDTLDPGDR